MKRLIPFFTVLIVLSITHVHVIAQQDVPVRRPIPRWAPASGYWVGQGNLNDPKKHTIYFYTDQHELIYKETIEGVTLDLNARRVKMRLKKVLETSLLAWRQQRLAKENEGLVISLLQRK